MDSLLSTIVKFKIQFWSLIFYLGSQIYRETYTVFDTFTVYREVEILSLIGMQLVNPVSILSKLYKIQIVLFHWEGKDQMIDEFNLELHLVVSLIQPNFNMCLIGKEITLISHLPQILTHSCFTIKFQIEETQFCKLRCINSYQIVSVGLSYFGQVQVVDFTWNV